MNLPNKKNYDAFLEDFVSGLNAAVPDACFYLYGSYTTGECDFGRSDIDGGVILNSSVITPKHQVITISQILASALTRNRVPVQFNIIDRQTAQDGRFLSYTTDYTDWLKAKAKVFGPDYVQELRGIDYKMGVLEAACFNFRKTRNLLLAALDNIQKDPEKLKKDAEKSAGIASKFPKKLICLRQGILTSNRFTAQDQVGKMFPELDLSALDRINSLQRNVPELITTISDPNRAIDLMTSSLGVVEQLVSAYLSHFPEHTPREYH